MGFDPSPRVAAAHAALCREVGPSGRAQIAAELEEANLNAGADRAEILDLLNRHQIYIDLRDAEGYASVYSNDGFYQSPVRLRARN